MPYFDVNLGVAVVVPSLMVSASNTGRVWVARTMGEHEFKSMLLRLAARSRLRHALSTVFVSAAFIMLLGVLLMILYPYPTEELGFWFALGIVAYGLVVGVHGSIWFVKLFKEATATPATP